MHQSEVCGTTDATSARKCCLFDRLPFSNLDLGPSPSDSTEKSIRSELMILECSFPFTSIFFLLASGVDYTFNEKREDRNGGCCYFKIIMTPVKYRKRKPLTSFCCQSRHRDVSSSHSHWYFWQKNQECEELNTTIHIHFVFKSLSRETILSSMCMGAISAIYSAVLYET